MVRLRRRRRVSIVVSIKDPDFKVYKRPNTNNRSGSSSASFNFRRINIETTYENRAKQLLRSFYRKYKQGTTFQTGNGNKNNLVFVNKTTIHVQTNAEREVFQISREKMEKACIFLFYIRTTTRKQLERFSKFSSSLLGLLLRVFSEPGMARVGRTVKGLLRLSLRGVRWFTAGCSRAPKDMEIVKFYNGQWLLLSYFHLREDKSDSWRKHVWRLGFKGRILLDSGGFSLHKAKLDGKHVDDIKVDEYCDFIKRHGGTTMFCGWFSLDKVDDPEVTETNIDYMVEHGLGEGLIPIWNINNSYSNLKILINNHDSAIVGVGGLLFCERKERKKRLDHLFQLFPDQLFHGLGVSNDDLFNYNWHSCDGTGVFSPRKYGKIYTYDGQIPIPNGWTVEQGIGYGLEVFVSQEDNYHQIQHRKLLIAPASMPEPLRLF